MYDELIAELRQHHCDAKEDDTQEVCEECAYDVIIADKSVPSGIASVCVCGLMNRAADAIEELRKRVPPVPHGDLIDRDALKEAFCGNCFADEKPMECFEPCRDMRMILDAPTVIEKEGDEG